MHRPWAKVLVLGVHLAVVLACPRLVTPETAGAATLKVDEVRALIPRPVPAGNPADLCVFAQDILVIRGSGWSAQEVEVEVGAQELPLVLRTATELQARIPDDLEGGPLSVFSLGRAGGETGKQVCALGPGHPRRGAYLGSVEPALTLQASGTTYLPCLPGASDTNPYCQQAGLSAGVVGVGFQLTPTATFQDAIYLSQMNPLTGSVAITAAPEPPGQNVGRQIIQVFPMLTAAELGVIAYYDNVANRYLLAEEAFPNAAFDQFNTHLWAATQRVEDASAQLVWSSRGPAVSGTVLKTQMGRVAGGVVHMTQMVQPNMLGWFSDASVTVSLDPDSGARRSFVIPRALAVAAGTMDARVLSPALEDSAVYLVLSLSVDTQGQGMVHALRVLPNGQADMLCGTAGSLQPCGAGVVQPAYQGPVTCLGGSCTPCLNDLLAAVSLNALDLRPVAQNALLVTPSRSFSPLSVPEASMCMLTLGPTALGMTLLSGQRFSAVTTVPREADGGGTATAFLGVPLEGSQIQPVLWSLSQEGAVRIPTPTAYLALHTDPSGALVYAIPQKGGRVDVLLPDGRLVASTPVLGPALGAALVPDTPGHVRVAYSGGVLETDAAGTVVASRITPLLGLAVFSQDATQAYALSTTLHDAGGTVPQVTAVELLTLDVGAAAGAAAGAFGQETARTALPLTAGKSMFLVEVGSAHALVVASGAGPGDFCQPTVNGAPGASAAWVQPLDGATSMDQPLCHAVTGIIHRDEQRAYVVSIDPLNTPDAGLYVVDLTVAPLRYVRVPLYVPLTLAADPQGGVLGVFFSFETLRYSLGRLVLDMSTDPPGTDYTDLGLAPFTDVSLVVSPDGRRVYAGDRGRITEMQLDHPDGSSATLTVTRQLPIVGRAHRLLMDASGQRLLYVDLEEFGVGVLE